MEDEERQKKLEAGKAKLAQFRQRKAQGDGQNVPKKQKKKKKGTGSKESEISEDGPDFSQSQSDDSHTHSTQRGAAATTEYTILRTLHTGETLKHDQTYTIEEEEYGVGESYSEHDIQNTQTRLEVMEEELAAKQQEVEELSRELEEIRAMYGTEGLQQLQDFETAIKQRDGIITQLTANLQQARKEKDDIMREFLELTEQSQKLKIQFQHLQAGETLRNTSHTSTAADLLHAKQQILTHQQQLEEQILQINNYRLLNEEYQKQITVLEDRIRYHEEVPQINDFENLFKKELYERDELIEGFKRTLAVEEKNTFQLKENLFSANKSLEELKEQIALKNQELSNLAVELANSKQREKLSSEEIKQLMGTVEGLQKQFHKDSLAETNIAHKSKMETQRQLEQLRAELDEMYGQQIVQMKQELVSQHALEISKITAQHKEETQYSLKNTPNNPVIEEQVHVMNQAMNELNVKLQDANFQRDKMTQELSEQLKTVTAERNSLQAKIEDLLQELSYAREQICRVKENLADKEFKLSAADKFKDIIEELKSQIVSASEFTKELESKHDAEVTNYKIKLEMLEREKDAVLDRMAESQESELERLRTQLLFSHEEELCKLREDLEHEHKTNIENLKDNMASQYKQQLDHIQNELTRKMECMQCEKENLITKQSQLVLEISNLTDLQQSVVHSKSEEMSFKIVELQKEIESLRKNEKEKDYFEQQVKELHLKIELLEKELKDKEEHFTKKVSELHILNILLGEENLALKENHKRDRLEAIETPGDDSKEKGSLDQRVQQLHLKIELLEKELKDKEEHFSEMVTELDMLNRILKDENIALKANHKRDSMAAIEEPLTLIGSVSNCDNTDFQKEIETLTFENEQLRKQVTQLKEEIKRQKNTFSFAEKNFEVNYQELQEEYACLLKVKAELELSKIKQEAEFESKFKALNEDLKHLQNKQDAVSEIKNTVLEDLKEHKEVRADAIDVTEIVEKDTTELMEKLEIAHREKLEMSVTLANLTEELELKHSEIVQLNEEILSLKQEKECVLTRCKELEDNYDRQTHHEKAFVGELSNAVGNGKTPTDTLISNVSTYDEPAGKVKSEDLSCPTFDSSNQQVTPNKQKNQQANNTAFDERQSLLDQLDQLTEKLSSESLLLMNALKEKDVLKHKLLQSEQADVKLQMEAQRISLTQVHAAQLEVVCENLQAEKEKALCDLRNELISAYEEEMRALQSTHQREQDSIRQYSGDEAPSSQILLKSLTRAVKEECSWLSEYLFDALGEKYSAAGKREVRQEDDAIRLVPVTEKADILNLQMHIGEAEELQANMQSLVAQVMKEHNRLMELRAKLKLGYKKVEQCRASNIQIHRPEEISRFQAQNNTSSISSLDFTDINTQLRVLSDPLKVVEKLKVEFSDQRTQLEEQHAKKIEHLRSYFEHQLNETEERYSTEMIHLHEKFQDNHHSDLDHREWAVSPVNTEQNFGGRETTDNFLSPNPNVVELDDICLFEEYPLKNSSGPIHQLQNLRQSLSTKYMKEVSDLKKQHQEELEKLAFDLKEQYSVENAALRQEIFQLTKSMQENLNGGVRTACIRLTCDQEDNDSMDVVHLVEKLYQERIAEDVAKVIVEMTIAFAQQTELARISRQQEVDICDPMAEVDDGWEKADNRNTSYSNTGQMDESTAVDVVMKEPFFHLESTSGNTVLSFMENEIALEGKSILNNDNSSVMESALRNGEATSSSDSVRLQVLFEERVEDMRQEIVRQDQEHQLATEALRHAHMQQMERQREDQEQLLEELVQLKAQLKQRASLVNEIRVEEMGQIRSHEREVLQHVPSAGTRQVYSLMQESSTQTEEEKKSNNDPEVPVSADEKESEYGKEEQTSAGDITRERQCLQKANNRLLKILLEVVKMTVAVEETIGRHVLRLLDKSGRSQPTSRVMVWEPDLEGHGKPCALGSLVAEEPVDSCHGSDVGADDVSIWSGGTEDGLELSQWLSDSGFAGVEIDPENEELVLNISSRLQAAVEKLLEAINETNNQLEHAKATQTELVRESIKRKQEITDLLKSQDELQERLNEEAKAREHLASELSKAEGLLDGYTDERVSLEKQMQEKTDLIHRLEQELQSTGNRLQELEEERQQVQVERELLSRQKDAMKADATSAELQLLEETEKLMKEKIEVQRQAEKEHEDLYKQLKVLETEMEEQVSRYIELEQERNVDVADLRQKNQALEKQLDKTRKFLDEQAVDREHERDVFQQEIQKLEQQLKIPQKLQPVNEDQTREVERLSNHLQERTDKCSELFLSKEQLQRDVQERNEEIEKLECRIRELEQALIISTDDLQQVDEIETLTTVNVKGELPLEAQLQVEREAIDRKENEITNLEEQLEQFREELENKIEEVQQLHMQLEIQRKESTTRLQELEQENKLFKDELENLRIVVHISEEDPSANDHYLHSGKCTRIMQEKAKEIDHLNEQIAKLQQQLEDVTDNKVTEVKNGQIRELEAQVEYLKSDQERVKNNGLEEIEQLNDVIEKLQQELANIEGKVPVDLSIISEDGDSLKHQLDTVLAENRNLKQIIDTNNAEVTLTKRELKEANDQMKLLKEQLETWEIEQGTLKHKANSAMENSVDVLMAGDSRSKNDKLEEALRDNAAKSLTYQSLLTSVEETTQDTVSSMELKLKELQDTVWCKDSELSKCYKQIQILEEQNESERAVLENRLLEMEENMRENLAAVLVSQAQLKAVKVQTKYIQNMEANSFKFDHVLNSSAQSTSEAQAESQVSAYTLQLLDMNNQLAEIHKQLLFEKEQVNNSQREAAEKEQQLSDLRKIIDNLQENQSKQDTKELLKIGVINPSEVPAGATSIKEQSVPLSDLRFELEKIRAEAATVKEQLNDYREKAEKLTAELAVKETSFACLQEDLSHVKQSLTKAEMNLEQYVKLEYQLADQTNVDFGFSRALATNGSHLITTTASSQTDKALTVNNSNQTVLVNQRDAEIQKDLSHTEKVCSSEKVTEVLNQYTEKIVQMQELHAAEILDMEARHISEAEALRREKFVAVQSLTEECEDLRAMIESLNTKQGIAVSGMQHSTSYQNTEGTSSDDASDWSQGTGTAEGFIPTSERMSAETEASTFLIPDKIKSLLRAVHREGMQVLSLSEEYPNSEKDIPFLTQGSEEWFEERKGFLNAIGSLKDLIAKMQVHKAGQLHGNSELSEQIPDWRGELLGAIQDVFLREQDVLVAAFRTQLAVLGDKDAALLVNQLQDRLQEQGMEHINAMDCIRNADRRSLLLEIQALRAQKSDLQMDDKNKQQMDPNSQGLMAKTVLNTCTSMQEKFTDVSPRSTELQEQLYSERLTMAELKTELAQTTLELESTLKAQHKHFKELDSLREEVIEKAAALDTLNDTLVHEQKRTRELQWAMEKEKAKMERIEERGKEELEDLKFSLEDHKLKIEQLNELLEQQRSLVTELQQKVESQEAQYEALLSQERGRNAEIQVILEAEKVRAAELSDALDQEKELCAQLQSNEGKEQDGVQDSHTILLKELHSQLEEKRNRIVELVSDMEAQKLASLQMGQKLEDEGHLCKKALISEQEANKSANKKMGELHAKLEELQWQLEEKLQQVQKLQDQDRLLQERIKDLQSKERDGGKTNQSQSEQGNVDSNVTEWDTSSERTKSWILQQKEVATEAKDSGFPTQLEMNGGDTICGSDMAVESIRNRLQQVSSKLKQLASKAAKRILFEAADDEDFVWSQNSIQDILFQLQRLPELPSLGEGDVIPSGGSARTLTERLLRQNAELTGYVSRLTEEKNDLRNILIKLEEELGRYRERSASRDQSSLHLLDNEVNIDALIGSEREMWNREKRALQKSLRQAEAELSKLRAELRNDAVQRDLGGDSESMALKRMYGKFLRSESFRKALIYQKKYLLLLLGGFQECEEATLALIARMGGQPCYTDLEAITHHSRGFTRFRSAVRVSIAISRMKFLVRRWQRALGTSTATVNRNGFGQSSANEMRTDSPYLPSGGMELYGEQRLSSSRSRSGMESPRSTVNFQHRYHGVPTDLGPCSHLQNYDPDRALTDYINRLESLQRRLGNVQSGSSSAYNQQHYVMRR